MASTLAHFRGPTLTDTAHFTLRASPRSFVVAAEQPLSNPMHPLHQRTVERVKERTNKFNLYTVVPLAQSKKACVRAHIRRRLNEATRLALVDAGYKHDGSPLAGAGHTERLIGTLYFFGKFATAAAPWLPLLEEVKTGVSAFFRIKAAERYAPSSDTRSRPSTDARTGARKLLPHQLNQRQKQQFYQGQPQQPDWKGGIKRGGDSATKPNWMDGSVKTPDFVKTPPVRIMYPKGAQESVEWKGSDRKKELADGLDSLRNPRISMRPGQISMRPGQISMRPGQSSTGPGHISMRPGQSSTGSGHISMRPGQSSTGNMQKVLKFGQFGQGGGNIKKPASGGRGGLI